jgi:hypothetical protein
LNEIDSRKRKQVWKLKKNLYKILQVQEIDDIGSSQKKVRAVFIEDLSESDEMLSLHDSG